MSVRILCFLLGLTLCFSSGCSSMSQARKNLAEKLTAKPPQTEDDPHREVGQLARGNRKKDKEPSAFWDQWRDPRVFDIERNVGITY